MEFNNLLKELDLLNLPKSDYAITGSGPLAIRGIRAAKDLDILVTESLWNKLVSLYSHTDNSSLKIGNIELFYEKLFSGGSEVPTVAQQIASSEIINDYPFVNLETVKLFKRLGSRDKDKADIELLERYEENKKI